MNRHFHFFKFGNAANSLNRIQAAVRHLFHLTDMKRQWKKEIPRPGNYFILYGLGGILFITLLPSVIYPMLYPSEFNEKQKQNRKGIKQEDIQPGNMNVWSNPFETKKN